MLKNALLTQLSEFRKQGLLCYLYRETAFEAASYGKVDNKAYLITDSVMDSVKDALIKCGIKDSTVKGGNHIQFRTDGILMDVFCGGELTEEQLNETVRMDLTVHSMLMKDTGDVYDSYGGMDDCRNRIIRCTGEKVKNGEQLAFSAMVLLLKQGYTVDKRYLTPLNNCVKSLPLPRKTTLNNIFRNYLKSENLDGKTLLGIVGMYGFCPNAGRVSYGKAEALAGKIKEMKPLHRSALSLYLCGVKPEELKNFANPGFAREFYECLLKFIGADLSDKGKLSETKRNCTPECFETLIALQEALALIQGRDYTTPKLTVGGVFREMDKSDKWVSSEIKAYNPVAEATRALQTAVTEDEDVDDGTPMDMGVFGGKEEEGYVEYGEEDSPPSSQDNSPFRRPSDNFYVSK